MPKLAAIGVGAALLATACGSGGNLLQGKSPDQIIQLAAAQVSGQSYHFALDGTVNIDTSGVTGIPQDQLGQLSGALQNLTMTGKGDVQDLKHVRIDISVGVEGVTKSITAVLYDGHYYVSLDGDGKYADAGSFNLSGLTVSPADVRDQLSGAGDVSDLGQTVYNGVKVEHLHATLAKDYLSKLVSKMSGGGSGAAAGLAQSMATLFQQAVSIDNGTIDAFVRDSDGRLEAEQTKVKMSMDMGRLMSLFMGAFGGQIPPGSGIGDIGGKMVMSMDGTTRFSDYGAKISVNKPTVDPNAPSLPSNLFGNLGNG
jgi:hypothetical protein